MPHRRGVRRVIWRRWTIASNAWIRWRIRHRRKSALQRDWESGDPVRMARVREIGARIRAEIAEQEKEEKELDGPSQGTAVLPGV